MEDDLNHGLETAMGGSSAQSEGQYHNNSNYWLRFDAYQDIVIESVKVFANGADDRTIAVIDAAGNILDQVTVSVPDGESVVELGLEAPAGVALGLRSLDNNPQLWRDGQGSDSTTLTRWGDSRYHIEQRQQPEQRHQLLLLLLRLDCEHPRHRLCF